MDPEGGSQNATLVVLLVLLVLVDVVVISSLNKKAQLSLTNPRDACEKFARFT